MLLDEILNEARFRKPKIMFHGTTSAFLRTILKQGLVPNPTKKYWDDDDVENAYAFSRKSLSGSYWTSNLMTAISSSTNTNRKFPGNSIIIIAQIAEQSAYADEDDVNSPIMLAMGDTVSEINPKIRRDFWMYLADDVFGDDPVKRNKVQNIFAKYLHQHLKGHEKHMPDQKLCKELLDTLVMRSMLYEKRNGMDLSRWITKVPEKLPSIREIETKLLFLRDRITKSYRASAFYTDGAFNHTLRIDSPVGFSGANKILSIVEIPPSWAVHNALTLVYGDKNLPESFLKQYKNRVGYFVGLNDTDGNVIIPPEKGNET